MSVASNTRGCFSEFVGLKVVGVLFDAIPVHRRDLARGTKALVFEDGRALVVAGNGSFWIEDEKTVARAILMRQRDLESAKAEIEQVLDLAGAMPSDVTP